MTLIFRSVWRDDSLNAVVVLDEEFRKWCTEKTGLTEDEIPYRGTLTAPSGTVIDIRRADTEQGIALQCVLRETDPQQRQWTTTAIAMTVGSTQTFWIDLDLVSEPGLRLDVAAPRLVRNLLKRSKKPVADGLIIDERVEMVDPSTAQRYAEELSRRDRRLPIVTFSPDRSADPETTFGRAEVTARALAGVAQVFVLSPKGELEVQKHMPKGFWVYGGAVRLYFPPVDFENVADSVRHPYMARHLIAKHSRAAASTLGRRIALSNLHPPVPEGWSELQSLLRRPSEQEIRERAVENKALREPFVKDAEDTGAEIELLEMLLAEGDLIRADLEKMLAEKDSYIHVLEEQHLDDAAEIEWASEQIERLQSNFRMLANHDDEDSTSDAVDLETVDVPGTIEDVIELAREVLTLVVISEDAPQDLETLDEGHKARIWARTTWQGLVELNKYAAAKAAGLTSGSFRDWCLGEGNWSPDKLSMVESPSVRSDPRLWDKRYFSVSRDAVAVGKCHMESHLKIQVGGGNSIPRLYFLDDTDGPTKKVHVGFIGPHYLVPNTKS